MNATSAALISFPDHPAVRFEQDAFQSTRVVCAWPRTTMFWQKHDPAHECGWVCPEWDEDAMIAHARSHMEVQR